MVHIIIAVVITAVVAILLTYVASNAHFKKVSDEKIGSAEDRARAIIDEAVKDVYKRQTLDCPAGLQEKVCCKSPVQRQTDRLGCFPLCFQERCAEPLCDGSLLTDVFPFITIDKIE